MNRVICNKCKCFIGKNGHKCKGWNVKEIEFIKNNYLTIPYKNIAKELNRSYGSIMYQIRCLNIKKINNNWTGREIDFLKDKYKEMTCPEISRLLGKSNISIRHKLSRLHLKRDKETLYKIHFSKMCGDNHPCKRPEVREKLRVSKLGERNHLYGKHHSEETRKKISESNKGKLVSEETRKKLSKSITGRHHSKETIEKMRNRTCSEETRRKMSESAIGKKLSELTKKRISLAHIGREFSEIHKQNLKKTRAKQIFPTKDTKIELKIQNFLKTLGIEFFTHQYIKDIEHRYQCDILIPSMKMVIEADGNYWHKYPIGNEIDHVRTSELLNKGFKVLRLWEFEINDMTIKQFKERLI